jgi:hypothetical protein
MVRGPTVGAGAGDVPSAGTSPAQALGDASRGLLGVLLLVVGGALLPTLWLLPVGLPLALLGAALIAAPGSPGPCRSDLELFPSSPGTTPSGPGQEISRTTASASSR